MGEGFDARDGREALPDVLRDLQRHGLEVHPALLRHQPRAAQRGLVHRAAAAAQERHRDGELQKALVGGVDAAEGRVREDAVGAPVEA